MLETFGVTRLTRKVDERYDHVPRASSTCPRNLVSRGLAACLCRRILVMRVRPFTAIVCLFFYRPFRGRAVREHLDACREYSRHTCCLYHWMAAGNSLVTYPSAALQAAALSDKGDAHLEAARLVPISVLICSAMSVRLILSPDAAIMPVNQSRMHLNLSER